MQQMALNPLTVNGFGLQSTLTLKVVLFCHAVLKMRSKILYQPEHNLVWYCAIQYRRVPRSFSASLCRRGD